MPFAESAGALLRLPELTAHAGLTGSPALTVLSGLLSLAALAGLAALTGQLLRRRMLTGHHRSGDERALPPKDQWWLVPAFALTWPLLAVAGAGESAALLVALLAATIPLAWLVGVDLDVHRLPNRVTLPGALVGPVVLAGIGWSLDNPSAALRGLTGGLVAAATYGLLFAVGLLLARPGLGLGDVKFAGALGPWPAFFGWTQLAAAGYLALVLGALAAVVLLLTGRATGASEIAHGPAMALATLVSLVLPI